MTTTDINAAYEVLKREVAEVRDHVREHLIPGTREEELYKGTTILYSELIHKPDFMFIGINPGAGFFKSTGIKERAIDLEPCVGFEYINAKEEGYDYALAVQTRTAFEASKHNECLPKSVKSNLFYTSTSSQNELKEFLYLLIERLDVNYYAKSIVWTKQLIELVAPKVIICEGAWVVNLLCKYYEVTPVWRSGIAYCTINGGISVIGYKRRYSHMLNMDHFVTALNSLSL